MRSPENRALIFGEKKGKVHAVVITGRRYLPAGCRIRGHVDFIKSPGHWIEFKNAIKGGEPAKSNFVEYAVPLTSVWAIWQADKADTPGTKIEWDAKNLTATNVSGDSMNLSNRSTLPGYSL